MENNSNHQPMGQPSYNQANELSIRDYLFIIRFHYKKVLLLTIIGLGLGIYSILTKPPSYRATATVVIQEKPGAGMIMDLTGNRDRNRITNEIQLIKSRSVAKDAIKEIWPHKKNNLALFGSYPFYPRGRRARLMVKEIMTLGLYDPISDVPLHYNDEYSDQIGERFAGSIIDRLSISTRNETNIIDISYTSVWPEEAKLIVNNNTFL